MSKKQIEALRDALDTLDLITQLIEDQGEARLEGDRPNWKAACEQAAVEAYACINRIKYEIHFEEASK